MSEFNSLPDSGQMGGQPAKRNWLLIGGLGCGGVVVLCFIVLLVGGLLLVRQRDQLLESAATHRASGNYEAAVADLQTLVSEHAESDQAAEAKSLIPQVELEWAADLRGRGEYLAALEKYGTVNDPAVATAKNEGVWETHLAWGTALLAGKKYAEALKQFNTVTNLAPEGSDVSGRAHAAIPPTYVGLAEEALAAGDIPTAYTHYTTVFENYPSGDGRELALASFATQFTAPLLAFAQSKMSSQVYSDAVFSYEALVAYAPTSPEAAEALAGLPNAYYLWARQLDEAAEYTAAIEKYEYLLATYPNSEFTDKAQKGMIDAQVAAVNASGDAGQLPSPSRGGSGSGSAADTATYIVENDTVCPILLLASGPGSQSLTIPAGQTTESEFLPGTYNVVVQVDGEDKLSADCQNIIPFTGEYIFDGGYEYNSSFYIE